MNKFIRSAKFIILSITGIIFLFAISYFSILLDNNSNSHPFPYDTSQIKLDNLKVKMAEKAHILFIGDRMGISLGHYIPYINKKVSTNLKSPLTIFNWSEKNESIIRTLHKIKSLKIIPRIIIYHGSSSELFEKYFEINDYKKIIKNIEKFNNPYIQTALDILPIISKVLFQSTAMISLNTKSDFDNNIYSDHQQQRRLEITYHQYKYHLDKLIERVRKNNSDIILLSTPLNLKISPRTVCSNTTTNSLNSHLQKLKKYLQQGKSKIAYLQLKALSIEALSNAKVFFLLGEAAYQLGKINEARKAYYMATAYDCTPWRGNHVFNSIINKTAVHNRLKLIDFNQIVNTALKQNILFYDALYPQSIYYEDVSNQLIQQIKVILNI